MKKKLRIFLLALAAVACFALMATGSLAALFLSFIGILGFAAGLSPMDLHLLAVALFGLITVGLCSFACFAGLANLFTTCLDAISTPGAAINKRLACMTLISLAATVCIYLCTPGDWFLPACLIADVQHVLFILLYIREKRGKSHDPNRP